MLRRATASHRLLLLNTRQFATAAPPAADTPQWVTATAEGYSEGSTTLISKDGRKLLVDEPPRLGGKGIGANPLTFFLSGLLGCTQYTVWTVAKEMKLSDKLGRSTWAAAADFDMRGLRQLSDAYDARFQRLDVTGTFDAPGITQAELDAIAAQVERRCIIAATLKASGMSMHLTIKKGEVAPLTEPPFDS